MKKLTAAVLTLSMMLSFTACSNSGTTDNGTASTADSQTADTTAPADDNSTAETAATTEAATEPTTEAVTEAPVPEVPDGYERVTFNNEQFGVNISFAVKKGAEFKQGDTSGTSYEDEAHDGWCLSYELLNVCPVSVDAEQLAKDKEGNGSVADAPYDNVYGINQDDWKSLHFYGDDYLDGRLAFELTFTSFHDKMDHDEFKKAIEVAAQTMYVEDTGSNQLNTADGSFQSSAKYVTIAPELTVDGQKLNTAWKTQAAGYPRAAVSFTDAEGEAVTIREAGGWGGKLYSSRTEDDDYRKVEVGGYPALCTTYNALGVIESHYIILLGENEKEEENFEVYVSVEGDYESTFLKDLLDGVSDSDLLDRMDRYVNDFMAGVTYANASASAEETDADAENADAENADAENADAENADASAAEETSESAAE